MALHAQYMKRNGEINTSKALFFSQIVQHSFRNIPGIHHAFLSILFEYQGGRIEQDDMYQKVKRLFWEYPVIIRGFYNSFPQPISTEDDDIETPRSDKKAKIEDDSSKAIPVASCSSSSPSGPGNAAQADEAEKKETAQSGGRTLYVTGTKAKVINESEAYRHIVVLVNQIGFNRFDIYAIMEYASEFIGGYPELMENFNIFLPAGYKIVVSSDDHEMNTD